MHNIRPIINPRNKLYIHHFLAILSLEFSCFFWVYVVFFLCTPVSFSATQRGVVIAQEHETPVSGWGFNCSGSGLWSASKLPSWSNALQRLSDQATTTTHFSVYFFQRHFLIYVRTAKKAQNMNGKNKQRHLDMVVIILKRAAHDFNLTCRTWRHPLKRNGVRA